MGNACCHAQDAGLPDDRHQGPFTVYGDYFNSDTRAILAICKLANVKHNFQLVDTLTHANLDDNGYKKLNPTGHIPMLMQKKIQVLAPGFVLYEWILKTSEPAQ